MEEACCLAFDTVPSDLHRRLFWEVTLDDIRTKIKLRIGHETALAVQTFQSLVKVVSLAFGSEKKRPPVVQDKDELKAKFAGLFGGNKRA